MGARFEWGLIHRRTRDDRMSDRDVERWSREVARDPGARCFVSLARAFRRNGRADAARDVVRRGLERHPDHVEARELLALLHLEAGDHARAGDEWSALLSLDPTSFAAHRGLGFLALEERRFEDARPHLVAAADARPGDPAVRQALQVLTERQGAGATAQPDRSSGPAIDPERVFEPLTAEAPFLGALVLDRNGLVLAGAVPTAAGDPQLISAFATSVVAEASRTAELTGMGPWTGALVDCDRARAHVAPHGRDRALIVLTRPGTPEGWVVRTADRAQRLARALTADGA